MAEVGESSSPKLSQNIWAKLVPSDSRYCDVEISSEEAVIRSEILSSSPDKHEWCKITRNSDHPSATLQNKSSNAILVDEAVVQNGEVVDISSGSEIIPAPDRVGYLSYRFKVMPRQESCKQQLKISIDVQHAKCCICLNVWHDVVTVAPCLHNFCNGCFSEWLRRSQDKRATVLCPHCRAIVQFVGRNHYLRNVEECILDADSSLKRSDEEVALLDSYASVKSYLVIESGKKLQRKRAHSPHEDENDSRELPCPQCIEVSGFRCNPNTVHLQCHACGGMMPFRTDIHVPQHCVGCDRAFCGAYWQAQMVNRSDIHHMCSHSTFKPISERTLPRIPFTAHEMNRHEQDITERCIRETGTTLQNVISDWIVKLNNREIDRSRLLLNHAETITAGTHICNECYDKLVSFLLYWFRITMPKDHLPADARQREDCWYGYACRTQHHNEVHARKRNHVCRPTRGSNMT
ncbi:E3 ubiquitin-protein ligase CHFR-like isoform X2 [Mangifera indica]|uniref:E3 ubiquitin-protein ligase CHFR-like isoform X2 n=1 Tax=Mangifera indica TaxID=29780 RepID=UPI001CFA3E51|nr:E3 ubiquitin-protein ligase CHFR-like isoform X2 [Mangifera indica]XP_044479890.1 E3 ubiquitin-protein ligase CHFR-like isoform X2 [Mangifera indica]